MMATSAESRRRSVAFFSPGWPPGVYPNGIVTYVATIRPALERLGVSTHVAAFGVKEPAPGAPPAPAIDLDHTEPPRARRALLSALSRLPSVPIDAMAWGWNVAQRLSVLRRERGLDLVEMEESFGAARYTQQGLDIPVVVRLHGPRFLNAVALGLPTDDQFHRIDRAERRCVEGAIGLTAPSRDVLDRVRDRYDLALPRAAVIPNPVPLVPPQRRWRLDACDRNTVLFVGRFDRHKGGDLVIDAFRDIAAARPDAELAFVGPDRGLIDDAGRTHALADYLDRHLPPAARARTRILGTLQSDEIEELRRRAYVTVVASRYEIFGLALAEALAFGCPTVAADAGGIPEVLLSGRNGLLFKAGDAAALAAAVQTLFDHPEQAADLGRQAADDAARRLSPDAIARTTLDYYQSLWDDRARVSRLRLDPRRALYALSG
jgi:glycosyltransferase involved in cell wall biosynthesis